MNSQMHDSETQVTQVGYGDIGQGSVQFNLNKMSTQAGLLNGYRTASQDFKETNIES